jgi:DNA-3-methyladenine glycosylase II
VDHSDAIAHLRSSDPVMAKIVDAVGPCLLTPGARGDHFTTLLRSIVAQQLSAKAAESIWKRVLALHPVPRRVRPEDVLALPEEVLRGAGLSASKVSFMKDLAAHVADRRLKLPSLSRLADEEIVRELVAVKGIGRWTAEMFLIFKLGRPDVFAVDDLGLRNAVKRHYGIDPSPHAMREVAEPWRPWRSVASWYLWRSLALEPV